MVEILSSKGIISSARTEMAIEETEIIKATGQISKMETSLVIKEITRVEISKGISLREGISKMRIRNLQMVALDTMRYLVIEDLNLGRIAKRARPERT